MRRPALSLIVVSLALGGCSLKPTTTPGSGNQTATTPIFASKPVITPAADESPRHITILSTNDIHGGIEPTKIKDKQVGGLAMLGGVVQAIRTANQKQYGPAGGVLLLDAGDQFQGTLISNYNEGSLVYKAMDAIGYDAVVPGNHNYDFGPKGWLQDKVGPDTEDKNPRGVIEGLAKSVHFPLLSASTFYRDSLHSADGNLVTVNNSACKPVEGSAAIDWSKAKSPEFLTPYIIKIVAGVRVALIGIDNSQTPTTTTPENVSDLCFDDEAAAYKRARVQLEGKADIFVMIIHNGNIGKELNANTLVTQLLVWNARAVDIVIAGHTHAINNENVQGVRILQSGSGGQGFGRADLVWDPKTASIKADETKAYAGVRMFHTECDKANATSFCTEAAGVVSYDGERVEQNANVQALIRDERARIAPMAEKKLGFTDKLITRDRIMESPLANVLTDAFRAATKADISFLNTGGIREDIQAGDITYEDLFRVLPFANHGLLIGPMPWKKVRGLLERSIKTCGSYGALMQSGLRVEFKRDCNDGTVDNNAKLVKVSTVDGEVLMENSSDKISPERSFQVATLDFLAAGGSGYEEFQGVPLQRDLGIVREVLVETLEKSPAAWPNKTDGRWKPLNSFFFFDF